MDGETLNLNNSAYIPLPEELLVRNGWHFASTVHRFKSRSPYKPPKSSFSRKTSQNLGRESRENREVEILLLTTGDSL